MGSAGSGIVASLFSDGQRGPDISIGQQKPQSNANLNAEDSKGNSRFCAFMLKLMLDYSRCSFLVSFFSMTHLCRAPDLKLAVSACPTLH